MEARQNWQLSTGKEFKTQNRMLSLSVVSQPWIWSPLLLVTGFPVVIRPAWGDRSWAVIKVMGSALVSEPICVPDAMRSCDQTPKATDISIKSSQKEYGRRDIITCKNSDIAPVHVWIWVRASTYYVLSIEIWGITVYFFSCNQIAWWSVKFSCYFACFVKRL